MSTLESQWEAVSTALRLAAELIANFGFSERTLRADSVLIPVAYYLSQRGLEESYLNSPNSNADRRTLQFWVIRSLVKAGIWGSALDTLLSALRTTLQEHADSAFPSTPIESAMARLGKSLRFDVDELRDLVETPYGHRNVFPILSLLYPGVSVRGEFHVDHIFPRSWFRKTTLQGAGVPEEQIDEFRQKMDGLPNLQLLEGPVNAQKLDKLPKEWAAEYYPDEKARGMYLAAHDMHDLPDRIMEFLSFYEARRERIAIRLRELLGVTDTRAEAANGD